MTLDKLLAKKGLTARSFAEKIGITEQMISQIKKGKKPFPQKRIPAALSVLGVSEEEFLSALPTLDVTISARIPQEQFEALKKIAPAHVSDWQEYVLRRIIFEWIEAQKKK